MSINMPKYTLPFTTDCSGFATIMAKWSGAADPNGYGFNGYGNTDSMLAHSEHISRDDSQPGDFVVFGVNPSTHVVVLVQSAAGGHDALCVSHGQEADPIRVALSVEAASHSGETLTFLRLQASGSAPPPPQGDPFCPLAVDGSFGPQTIKALQWKLRVTTDGVFGPGNQEGPADVPPRDPGRRYRAGDHQGAAGARWRDPGRPVGAAHYRGTAARAERGSVLTRLRIWLLACGNTPR